MNARAQQPAWILSQAQQPGTQRRNCVRPEAHRGSIMVPDASKRSAGEAVEGLAGQPARITALGRFLRAVPRVGSSETMRYLTRWFFLSAAVGIVAGVGAISFYLTIRYSTSYFLGSIVGYLPPEPVGEGTPVVRAMQRPWLLPVVTGLGGLLSGLLVFSLAPEAEGHGTDAAIVAIHHKGGRIRARIPLVKLVASAITIGSGGSGGREGPAAQISAGFGSLLGHWLRMDAKDRRIAVAAGMGAGIGAIFRAPLGGAVLAAEILYLHDVEVEAVIPALIAAIVGYTIYGASFGFTPIFGNQPDLALGSPLQLVYYALLGLLCGLFGILYARTFYGVTDTFHHLRIPRFLKPALGGVLVGLLGLGIPQALHMGYGWVQLAMNRQSLLSLPLWVILVLPLAKILATALSIGSGGSGGIFGPGMVIGGILGASFWRLGWGVLPQMPASPAPFVIVGMMAHFGGIAHAPLAVMLMVAEMTGNLSLLAPAMVAVAVSSALVGSHTIYRAQLPDRASSPIHRIRFSFPMLSTLFVRDAMSSSAHVLREDASLTDTVEGLSAGEGVVVVNERQEVTGIITASRLRQRSPSEGRPLRARDVMQEPIVLLEPDHTLDYALEELASHELTWAPVVRNRVLLGRITVRDIMRTYRRSLALGIRRAQALTADTSLFEVRVDSASPLAGRTLREARLPADTLVISITRGGETIFPRASTRLEPGDLVVILSSKEREQALREYLERPGGTGAQQDVSPTPPQA